MFTTYFNTSILYTLSCLRFKPLRKTMVLFPFIPAIRVLEDMRRLPNKQIWRGFFFLLYSFHLRGKSLSIETTTNFYVYFGMATGRRGFSSLKSDRNEYRPSTKGLSQLLLITGCNW